jgi:hypothetical protein
MVATQNLLQVLDFQPDWVWGKSRSDVRQHVLFDDAVRGAKKN